MLTPANRGESGKKSSEKLLAVRRGKKFIDNSMAASRGFSFSSHSLPLFVFEWKARGKINNWQSTSGAGKKSGSVETEDEREWKESEKPIFSHACHVIDSTRVVLLTQADVSGVAEIWCLSWHWQWQERRRRANHQGGLFYSVRDLSSRFVDFSVFVDAFQCQRLDWVSSDANQSELLAFWLNPASSAHKHLLIHNKLNSSPLCLVEWLVSSSASFLFRALSASYCLLFNEIPFKRFPMIRRDTHGEGSRISRPGRDEFRSEPITLALSKQIIGAFPPRFAFAFQLASIYKITKREERTVGRGGKPSRAGQ